MSSAEILLSMLCVYTLLAHKPFLCLMVQTYNKCSVVKPTRYSHWGYSTNRSSCFSAT